MIVTFTRTGERRYGVAVDRPGAPRLVMHPALAKSERLAAGALRGDLDERLRARLEELSARWSALAVGEEMSVEWATPA